MENEYSLETIKEVVSYLYGYIQDGYIKIDINKEEQAYWDVNHYLYVELKEALDQAFRKIKKTEETKSEYQKMKKLLYSALGKNEEYIEKVDKLRKKECIQGHCFEEMMRTRSVLKKVLKKNNALKHKLIMAKKHNLQIVQQNMSLQGVVNGYLKKV